MSCSSGCGSDGGAALCRTSHWRLSQRLQVRQLGGQVLLGPALQECLQLLEILHPLQPRSQLGILPQAQLWVVEGAAGSAGAACREAGRASCTLWQGLGDPCAAASVSQQQTCNAMQKLKLTLAWHLPAPPHAGSIPHHARLLLGARPGEMPASCPDGGWPPTH